MAKLTINGRTREVDVPNDTPLLWFIREQVGLTGTKYGCGVAQCGACSVHINGEVQRSCSIRVGDVKPTDKIVTIEGLSGTTSHPVQRAWAAVDVPQCGYCQSGQIMAAAALLAKNKKPVRRRHRQRDDQHLPLRHLSACPRGDPSGGARPPRHQPRHQSARLRRSAMTKTISQTSKLSRRKFIVGSAAAPAAASRSA